MSSLLIGCATSSKRYISTYSKNVTINLKMDKNNGVFSSTKAYLGVNDLIKGCNTEYKGEIELIKGKNKLGLAPERLTYLIVEILQKNSFPNRTRTLQQSTLIKPKKGRRYEVIVNYVDNMFDFRLYEIRKSKRKQLQIIPLSACRS